MKRTRTSQAASAPPDLFGTSENAASAKPCSHSARQSDVLHAMARAFRACENARTLAWMAVEHKEPSEALKALRVFEGLAKAVREEYEGLL